MIKKNRKTRYADPNGYRFKGKTPLRQQLELDERGVAALLDHDKLRDFIAESDANLYRRCALGKESRAAIAKSLNVSDFGLKVMLGETEKKVLMQALYLGIIAPLPLKPPLKPSSDVPDIDFDLGQADTLTREDEKPVKRP